MIVCGKFSSQWRPGAELQVEVGLSLTDQDNTFLKFHTSHYIYIHLSAHLIV